MDSFVLQDSLSDMFLVRCRDPELQQQRRKPSVGHYEVDTDSDYTVWVETLRGPIGHCHEE